MIDQTDAVKDFLTMRPTFEDNGDKLLAVHDTPDSFVVVYEEAGKGDVAYVVLVAFKNGTYMRAMASPDRDRTLQYALEIVLTAPKIEDIAEGALDLSLLRKLYEVCPKYAHRQVLRVVEKRHAFIVIVRTRETGQYKIYKVYKDGDSIYISVAQTWQGANALVDGYKK